MKAAPFFLILFAAACTETGTGGFVTSSGVRVNAVNEQVFEVIPQAGAQRAQFWCGAGDYASRTLGASSRDRVYVVSEIGPGVTRETREAMQFSMSPPASVSGAAGNVSHWGPKIGDDRFVGDARMSCSTGINRFDP